MKIRLLSFTFLSLFSSLCAYGSTGFLCEVTGRYEGEPRPGNTHGTYSHKFTAKGATADEAKLRAFEQCKNSELGTNGCFFTGCRELAGIEPTPLGPDTEISCADSFGFQMEILLSVPGYYRTAIIRRAGVQVAAFGVEGFTPDTEPRPTAYYSRSSQYHMELSVTSKHFSLSGPGLYSNGTVNCIRPPLVSQPDPCLHHNCH